MHDPTCDRTAGPFIRRFPDVPPPPRVLVVAGDRDARESARAALERGRDVTLAADVPAGLAAAMEALPDVVVAAEASLAAELVRAFRAEARTRRVPVIVTTARAAGEGTMQAVDSDADELLLEPSARELAARVDAHARRARAREEALRQEALARTEAENSNRAKDEFIAMISHELRTPLGAILIWAQLLKSDEMDQAAVARAVGMIERSTKTLAKLIDDLLDVSRIIAGKLTFSACCRARCLRSPGIPAACSRWWATSWPTP
jgi:signal transduction histidine kinase